MKSFLVSRFFSFHYAISGISHILRTQKNSWIHLVATIIVVIVALLLRIGLIDFSVIILAIGLVWVTEAINTTLETIVDLVSPAEHPLAKVCKDVGAAAVLFSAITAVAIGVLILIPPIYIQLTSLIR